MVGGGDRAGEQRQHAADLVLAERSRNPREAHRGIGLVAAAGGLERKRPAKLPARSFRRIGVEIGEGERGIDAVDREDRTSVVEGKRWSVRFCLEVRGMTKNK